MNIYILHIYTKKLQLYLVIYLFIQYISVYLFNTFLIMCNIFSNFILYIISYLVKSLKNLFKKLCYIRIILFSEQLDAEDDDDDDDDYNEEDFENTRFEEDDEASNYWHLKDYTFGTRSVQNGQKNQRDDDETGSANPWRKTGGLRLTRNEYHRFCDAQLECNCYK